VLYLNCNSTEIQDFVDHLLLQSRVIDISHHSKHISLSRGHGGGGNMLKLNQPSRFLLSLDASLVIA
jgi:hypothetical protein